MTADIKDEIARRLNVAADDVAPALESVVERIRQQVEHYGYARLADLGTFRGGDERIVFEPDAALAETVNARFTGLEEIVIEDAAVDEPLHAVDDAGADVPANTAEEPSEPDEATAEEQPLEPQRSAQPPTAGTEVPEHEPEHDLEGTPIPDHEPEHDFEGTAVPEHEAEHDLEGTPIPEHEPEHDLEGTAVPEAEGAADDWEGIEEPAFADREPPEGTEAPPEDEPEGPYDEDDEAADLDEGEAYWGEQDHTSEDHPLGPESEPPYEEADFAVVGDRDDDAADAEDRKEPTISWEPLGAAGAGAAAGTNDGGRDDDDRDGEYPGDEDDGFDRAWPSGEPIEDDAFAAEDIEEPAAAGAAADEGTAPDPGAAPHGSSGPMRTIRPPTRRSHKERDMKPIWFGVGIIVLVAAAAVAYFTLPDTPAGPAQEEVAQTEPVAPPDTAAAEAAPDTAAGEAFPPPPPASTPLRSEESIDPAEGGFTIVVHSETSAGPAEAVAAQYRADGYRTGVLSAQQGGVTRYRVGVGQFETLDEATQQRNDLAGGDLPADAWVLRINQ